jgi:hypothetical protein
MGDSEAAERVLCAVVMTGTHKLQVTPFSSEQADASTGMMVAVRNTDKKKKKKKDAVAFFAEHPELEPPEHEAAQPRKRKKKRAPATVPVTLDLEPEPEIDPPPVPSAPPPPVPSAPPPPVPSAPPPPVTTARTVMLESTMSNAGGERSVYMYAHMVMYTTYIYVYGVPYGEGCQYG